jgi:hypothetical protein
MSLRGREPTEAISQWPENTQIATPACWNVMSTLEVVQALRRAGTLPSVARNDKEGITTQSLRGEEIEEVETC